MKPSLKPTLTALAILIGGTAFAGFIAGLVPGVSGYIVVALVILPVVWLGFLLGSTSRVNNEGWLRALMAAVIPIAGLLLGLTAGWKMRDAF